MPCGGNWGLTRFNPHSGIPVWLNVGFSSSSDTIWVPPREGGDCAGKAEGLEVRTPHAVPVEAATCPQSPSAAFPAKAGIQN